MNDPFLFQISAIFAAAGLVKGISGLGLPTFSMALLTLIMPAGQAASLMIFPSLTTNTAQCFGSQFKLLCKHLWPLWLSMLLGTLYWLRCFRLVEQYKVDLGSNTQCLRCMGLQSYSHS